MKTSGKAASVMVVDDEPANLKLLEEMLRKKGYQVRSFPRGRLALAAASQERPDLILLDINMPELSGYEVCQRLKLDPLLCEIPVIFLSALHEAEDKVKCFRAGGVDYLPKPFHFEELYARVETHLELNNLNRALKLHNERLEQAVALRTGELTEAVVRLTKLDQAKDDFLKIIAHELRTPLQGLFGMGQIALDAMTASEQNSNVRLVFARSRRRILSLLDNALLLTQIEVNREEFSAAPVSLGAALKRAADQAAEFAEYRHVTVPVPVEDMGLVWGQEDLLVSAFLALLETAIKFSADGAAIRVARETVADSAPESAIRIVIESQGRKIPDSALARFFDVFAISEAITPGGDLGLGPAAASRILSLFGGTVTVANHHPPGIRLTVSF